MMMPTLARLSLPLMFTHAGRHLPVAHCGPLWPTVAHPHPPPLILCMQVGICPQHDTLWPTLTAREHLLFYARIKVGSPPPRA